MPASTHRTTDQIKSLTFKLTLSAANLNAARGNTIRVTIPLNAMNFDEPSDYLPALFYSLHTPQLGSSTTPAPAGIRLQPTALRMTGADATNSRKAIISAIEIDLKIASDAPSFTNIPLIFKGANVCTDAPETFGYQYSRHLYR